MTARVAVVSVRWLTECVTAAFIAAGLPAEAAAVVAESLVDADRRGIPSHGALLVPVYVERLRRGSVSTRTRADVVVDREAVAVLDAGHALGVLVADQAMALAVEKSHRYGVGAATVRRAFHFGAAGRYARAAASAGCIGVVAANTRPLMPAPGGARAVVGNNPLAIAVPLGPDREPIVLDMATSAAAMGRIRLAAAEGREIPPGWATDADGRPTSDPAAALRGMLLPAAGAKGFGLAIVLEVLTGVLSGGVFGAGVQGIYVDTSVPHDGAQFFLALDIAAFGDGFVERAAQWADAVASSPSRPGAEPVRLPGQRGAERHRRSASGGVTLDDAVLAALYRVLADLDVAVPVHKGEYR